MSQMLMADPVRPVAIWLFLIVVSLPALLLLANPEAMRHPRLAVLEVFGQIRNHRQHRERRRRRAVETVRYAEEVQIAAARAHESAQRWQNLWQQSETQADHAWQAWQESEHRLTRARTASAFTTPDTPHTTAEYAAREHFLHRSLQAAVADGALPAETLQAAMTSAAWSPSTHSAGNPQAPHHSAGHLQTETPQVSWDPRLHPVEQEFVLLKAINEHRRSAYRQAAAAERAAWHDTQLAFTARDSLRREAAAAETQAAAVRRNLPTRERHFTPARRAWVQRTA
ncbi:hypothetical protein [Actinoplanes sp. HUAS TT8]|uniref:hypothetical protein n=1 Tax=Actinoplanes sp. HUAS TT8 TaxID=3447453 RepID=UPI003F521C37